MPDKYIEEAREIAEKVWKVYIEKAAEPVPEDYDWRKYDRTPKGMLTPAMIDLFAEELRSRDEQHRREVEELRLTVERRMRFDLMDPDQAMIAFDTTRASQLGSKEEKGG